MYQKAINKKNTQKILLVFLCFLDVGLAQVHYFFI